MVFVDLLWCFETLLLFFCGKRFLNVSWEWMDSCSHWTMIHWTEHKHFILAVSETIYNVSNVLLFWIVIFFPWFSGMRACHATWIIWITCLVLPTDRWICIQNKYWKYFSPPFKKSLESFYCANFCQLYG